MNKVYKILIVDDSMTAMLYTSNIVREAGNDPIEAINGKEALRKLRNDSFDMIISDILMPEMDGFQFLKHVKEDPDQRNIPFIFHTATYNSDEDKDFGIKLGVDAYIQKFKDPTELSNLIQDIFKELELGKFISNKPKIEQDGEVFKLYSERLINKLEKKNLDLEKEIIEHKKAAEDLKQYEKIVYSTSSLMSFVDNEYIYQAVSHSYLKALKKKREQIVGHSIVEIFGSEIFESQIKERIDRCFKGESVKYENWFNFAGIGKRYMQVSYYPFNNEENIISGVIIDSIDITERKQVETKLANKTMLLDNITNRASNISIITTDLNFKITTYNPYSEKFFGYSAGQVIGKTVHEMHFMENIEPERLTKALKTLNNTGEYNYIIKQQLPSGKRVLSSRVTKILNPERKLIGYSLFTHDVTKQVLAEEKLKVSGEKFHTVANFAYDWEYWISPQDEFIYISPSCKRITGYSPDEFMRNPELLTSIVHSDDVDNWKKHKHNVFDIAEIETIDFRIITKSGEVRWIGHVCQTVYNKNGVNIGIRGGNRDITKQKLTESALQESEELMTLFMDSATDSFTLWGPNFHLLRINPSGLSIFPEGTRKEDVVGKTMFDFAPNLKETERYNKYLKVIETGVPFFYEDFAPHTKFGYLRLSVRVFKVGEGFGIITENITERKKTEEALKVSEDRLSKTLIAANDGMWDWDLITNKVYFNPRYYEMAGYAINEFPYEFDEFQKRIHPDDVENVMTQVQLHIEGKTARFKVEFRFKKKSGAWLWMLGRGQIVERDKNNKPARFIGTHSDITDRKKAEDTLKKSEAKLRESNKTKDKFFSIISHDLRSPFNAILGFSDLLLENHKEYKDSVREKYIKAIDNSGRKAYELLDNLLVWANTQTDGISFEPQELDLKKTFEKLISLNEYNAASKNIKLSYSLSKEIIIYADLNMLNIILRNLISNAIKFTNSNGVIIVNAEQDNNKVIISVSDTGVGIKKSRLSKIFDLSEKISTIGTAKEKGTGLGLLLCKEFVEKHGGKIWVESEIEKGSKFTFSMFCCSNDEIEK